MEMLIEPTDCPIFSPLPYKLPIPDEQDLSITTTGWDEVNTCHLSLLINDIGAKYSTMYVIYIYYTIVCVK